MSDYSDVPAWCENPLSKICRELEWDSSFFGFKIGRVVASGLDQDRMLEILDWAASHQIDCLYFLTDPDAHSARLAEEHRFQLMDLRVTLARELAGYIPNSEPSDAILVRPAVTTDIPALRDIAATSHTDSRFYQDPHFSRFRCNELYRTWIEQSCTGFADMVLVAALEQRPAGYISCHLEGGTGRIGLVGVDSNYRNIGLGRILLAHALRWFSERAVKRVIVVTQGRNVSAQRLYQRGGFLTQSIQLWYHLWLADRRQKS